MEKMTLIYRMCLISNYILIMFEQLYNLKTKQENVLHHCLKKLKVNDFFKGTLIGKENSTNQQWVYITFNDF